MIRFVCLLVSSVFLFSTSVAQAGNDNGSKNDSRILVRNNSDQMAGVGIGLDLAEISNADDPLEEFRAQGGKILNPGQQAEFKVKAGSQRIFFAFPTALDEGDATLVAQQTINVTNRQTIRLVGTDSNGDDVPELNVQ